MIELLPLAALPLCAFIFIAATKVRAARAASLNNYERNQASLDLIRSYNIPQA